MRSFIIRHRFAIRDLSLIAAAALVGLYGVFAVDLFETEGAVGLQAMQIELDEALLVGVLVAFALLGFGARQYVRQRREMRRRIAAERQARELAYQDGLTGLPNRRQLDDALKAAIAALPRAGAVHAAFLLDLNGFKQINDVHGHGTGDEVLVAVGQRLRSAMRGGDMVARFGGDEFAILALHLAGSEAATNVALRVIEALEAPIALADGLHRVGAGIGIALIPTDAVTIEEILRKADVALYRAKAERRSALRFFEAEMDARVRERASMEAALRQALDLGHIETVFEPVCNLRTGEITGFEAEPRWVDPQQGEIPSARFIAIAEEAGLIHALAERVLHQACAAAVGWPPHVALAIDVWPIQLKDELLPARILRILADAGLSPTRLEVEITESAVVSDLDNAQRTLGALRAAGARIALDNFGTGYSSLYHLRSFKFDKAKIDRSFIEAMTSESESASIVSALVGLGHGLGFTIAAEGVQGTDQQHSLISTGCEEGQGHLFSGRMTARQTAQAFGRATKIVPLGPKQLPADNRSRA